jgi:galactonate dehydratase
LKTKEEGWRFVRWGLPQDSEVFEPRRSSFAAVEQMAAVRDAVGEEIEMILDVHTRLDIPDSLRLCREAEPLRPFFIEDPLERVMNSGENRIEMRIPRSAWFPRDLRFPHS